MSKKKNRDGIECPRHGKLSRLEIVPYKIGKSMLSNVTVAMCQQCKCFYSTSMLLYLIPDMMADGKPIRHGKAVSLSEVTEGKEAERTKKKTSKCQVRADVPIISSTEIYLTNRPTYVHWKSCPQCGEPTVECEVRICGRKENGTQHMQGHTRQLRYCDCCQIYYVTPEVLSEFNNTARGKVGVRDYVQPYNVRYILHKFPNEYVYLPEFMTDANELDQQMDTLYDLSLEDLNKAKSGEYYTGNKKNWRWIVRNDPDWEWLARCGEDWHWWETEVACENDKTLYVHKGNIVCMKQHHPCESVTAILKNLIGRDVRLNVAHCLLCDKYFIHNHEYEMYRKNYGTILGQIKAVNHDLDGKAHVSGEYGENLQAESTLHLFGYNVQKGKLSMLERQTIIVNVLAMEAMTKREVINLLVNLIQRNEKRDGLARAVEAWKEDLEFVSYYQMENQTHVMTSQIVPYCRNRFVSIRARGDDVKKSRRCDACCFSRKIQGLIDPVCDNRVAPRYGDKCEMCIYFEE